VTDLGRPTDEDSWKSAVVAKVTQRIAVDQKAIDAQASVIEATQPWSCRCKRQTRLDVSHLESQVPPPVTRRASPDAPFLTRSP
jgi:hypothetical protein